MCLAEQTEPGKGELPVIHGDARGHESSPRKRSSCGMEQRSKGRSSSQHAWGVTPTGSHRAGVWSPLPPRSPALSPGARLFSRHCRCRLPASLLISPSYNIITAGGECVQHSPDAARPSASRQLRDTRGLLCQSPSPSWRVKRSSCGTGCGSLNTEV